MQVIKVAREFVVSVYPLGKVLGSNYGKDVTAAAFAAIGIPHEIRPEKLTVEQFLQLTYAMFPEKLNNMC